MSALVARRLLVAVVLAAAIAGMAVAVQHTVEIDANGDPIADRPNADAVVSGDAEVLATLPPPPDPSRPSTEGVVERLYPARDGNALEQQQIGIDLTTDYTGTLVVNGVEIPEDQLQRRPELSQVFFQPGQGLAVEALTPGRNCVTALVWLVTADRSAARPIEWCFNVT